MVRYHGPETGSDYARAIALDGSGNVYVTGASAGSETASDYATIKYNSAGKQQWVARYDGPAHSNDHAVAIAVDGSDDVYVTGDSVGLGTVMITPQLSIIQPDSSNGRLDTTDRGMIRT